MTIDWVTGHFGQDTFGQKKHGCFGQKHGRFGQTNIDVSAKKIDVSAKIYLIVFFVFFFFSAGQRFSPNRRTSGGV